MSGSANKIVSISARKATLKRKIRRHLQSLGFQRSEEGSLWIDKDNKDVIREFHRPQRDDRLKAHQGFLAQRLPGLFKYFAAGRDLDPERITPTLERVCADTWQADLFRLAALTWSVPVSRGFGRRLRYLVWDAHNQKLIGLLAIGDPVFKPVDTGQMHRMECLKNEESVSSTSWTPTFSVLFRRTVPCLPARWSPAWCAAAKSMTSSNEGTVPPRASFPGKQRRRVFLRSRHPLRWGGHQFTTD